MHTTPSIAPNARWSATQIALLSIAAVVAAFLLMSYVDVLHQAVDRGVRLRYAQMSAPIPAPAAEVSGRRSDVADPASDERSGLVASLAP